MSLISVTGRRADEKRLLIAHIQDSKASLVDQTAPFPSTGCIASPARGREGPPLLQGFRGTEQNVDMTNEIRVVICIANYHVPQIP